MTNEARGRDIIHLLQVGVPHSDVARKFGLSEHQVRRIELRHKLPPPSPHNINLLLKAIRAADDPLKPWPSTHLVRALGLLPATRRALLEGHPQGLERGNFIKPTVFAKVTRDMRIAKEEIFGPVLSILTYKTEAEAIEIANDTEFGLIAYVSSADPERAYRVARKLAAGRVLINTVSHDPFAPFGGFKQSGIGREGGIFGLQDLEPKAIIG